MVAAQNLAATNFGSVREVYERLSPKGAAERCLYRIDHRAQPRVSNLIQTVAANLAQGGAQTRSASMSKADQFREYAEEAMRWSRQAKTEAAKNTLIDLALTWGQAASLSEMKSVGPLKGLTLA
jgi:lysyl-tRNA synthetase class I